MGAPIGNRNRETHGLRASTVGDKYTEGQVCRLRDLLVAAVLGLRGGLSVHDQALIQTAGRHESRVLLAAKWLRSEKNLTLSERLSLTATISNASDSRDKCIRLLGIDKPATLSPLAAFAAQAQQLTIPANGLAPATSHLASPQTPADVCTPVDTTEAPKAPQNASGAILGGIDEAATVDASQDAYTREDRSH